MHQVAGKTRPKRTDDWVGVAGEPVVGEHRETCKSDGVLILVPVADRGNPMNFPKNGSALLLRVSK